ncbi:hypothetical protein [Notoacmeibacter marinus]|nr:hypothetical protein [Notoacmeibacter marinus]
MTIELPGFSGFAEELDERTSSVPPLADRTWWGYASPTGKMAA